MRLLLCLDGPDATRVVAGALTALQLDGAAIWLLHVQDQGPRQLVDLARGRPGRPPLPPHRQAELNAAEAERADTLLTEARAEIQRRLTNATIISQVLAGQPERAIVAYADAVRPDLVVVGARPNAPPGPRSVGHVARFVLDHVGCTVLLIRDAPAGPG